MGKISPFTNQRKNSDSPLNRTSSAPDEQYAEFSNLNALCNSLISQTNRKKFRAFPDRYCREYGLTLEETHAVTDLDVVKLLRLGGGISSLERLTSIYGLGIMELCVQQTGKSLDEIKIFLDSF